jgi:hypothetical protein
MKHIIDSNMAVIIWETLNPAPRNSDEKYSYYVEYRDTADQLRESEICNNFFSPEHCIQDALANIDALDLRPEAPKAKPEPQITTPYHHHVCKVGCPNHRCVNPACMSEGEFPQRVCNIICPACGDTTGSINDRLWMKVAKYMPLVIKQANAA